MFVMLTSSVGVLVEVLAELLPGEGGQLLNASGEAAVDLATLTHCIWPLLVNQELAELKDSNG